MRSLIKTKGSLCYFWGKLDPKDVSIDHIIPLKKVKNKKQKDYGKFWLVKTEVNRMKGSLELNEFYQLLENILKNKKNTMTLKKIIEKEKLVDMSKEEFEKYLEDNFDENGIIKNNLNYDILFIMW